MSQDPITILCPDDWHVHFRQGDALRAVAHFTARQFRRALIMPNTKPPICTVGDLEAYDSEVRAAVRGGPSFVPYYALYLTRATTVQHVEEAAKHPHVLGFKLYPQGATTNSQDGINVHNLERMYPIFEAIAKHDLTLMIHGEVPGFDMFDRERYFIEDFLRRILRVFTDHLRITFEHITTAEAIEIVSAFPNVAATVTAHHLHHNRNAIFTDGAGLSPHHFCLPVLKTEDDRRVLLEAAISNPRVFAGTDSAPHPVSKKESHCAPAGCFTAPVAMQMYADAFDRATRLEALEEFASMRGARWYKLPINEAKMRLTRRPEKHIDGDVQLHYPFGEGQNVVTPWGRFKDLWDAERVA